jgi:SAM-dependent methyltransferase
MNSATHKRRETCRLCDSPRLELALPLAATPVGDAYVPAAHLDKPQQTYPLDLWLCRACGLAQLIDVVDPAILYVEYVYYTSISLGLVEHFNAYATDVCKRIQPPAGSLVVDVGSNDGTLLCAFKQQGHRVLGIDPARDVAERANQRGVETLNTFFSAQLARGLRKEKGPASILTANNVFANIDNLHDLCAGVLELLAPDGVFVMETSYLGPVVEDCLLETIFHEHLSYFSLKPLLPFFQRAGMEVIEAQRQPTKGGSLRLTMQRTGAGRPVSASVAEVLAYEEALGLHTPEVFQRLATRLSKVKEELREKLQGYKREGKTIAGYGASVGVVTLLYEWELEGLVSFLVDDHVRKQNTFSPGQHIPVYSPAALYERPVDVVLILAWNYAAPIMAKHPKFHGNFVVPLPEVRLA